MQVYLDSSVDGGFVNTFAKAFKQEPEDVRNQRIEDMKQELAEYIDSDGNLTVYRGSFERPFGREDDASRVIEKGFAFSLDREVAKNYATCWFPETAKIYEVKAPLSDVAWYSNYDEEKTVILLPQNRADSGRWHLRKLFRHPNTVRTLKKQLPYRLMLLLLRESKETDR